MATSGPDDLRNLPSGMSLAEALNATRSPQIFTQQFQTLLTNALEAGISKETLGIVFDKLSEANVVLAAKMMEQENPEAITTARRARVYLTNLVARESLETLAQRIRGEIVLREALPAELSGTYGTKSARLETVDEGVVARLREWLRKVLRRH